MYLQITTRCNMTCAHCCFSCTKDGEDMSLETFRAALKLGNKITLGGGEPTLHPDFDTILIESLAATIKSGRLDVVTNGSITKRALLLAHLDKCKLLWAQLSLDKFHDPIDSVVVAAFKDTPLVHAGPSGVKNTTSGKAPKLRGRAIALMGQEVKKLNGFHCMCNDFFVKPNGDIRQCGCDGSPKIGHVENGPVNHERNCCHASF